LGARLGEGSVNIKEVVSQYVSQRQTFQDFIAIWIMLLIT